MKSPKETKTIKLTREKSERAAEVILLMTPYLQMLDVEYLKAWASAIREQSSFQDSAAVLNRNYDPNKQNAMRSSAKAIEGLVMYFENVLDKQNFEREIVETEGKKREIEKMFL